MSMEKNVLKHLKSGKQRMNWRMVLIALLAMPLSIGQVFGQKNVPLFKEFVYEGNDQVYKDFPLEDDEFYNPILQGVYPDAAITRIGNDYYLVSSSFAFFPGIPIFHSNDLVNWKQIGHVLDRKSQLKVFDTGISAGIYAPAIKYNEYRSEERRVGKECRSRTSV